MKNTHEAVTAVLSKGIRKIPYLDSFLDFPHRSIRNMSGRSARVVAGWGCRVSTKKAIVYARRNKLDYVALEDGFLRSFGTGDHFPPLALVLDNQGIYYDCTRPSALESLLNSQVDLVKGIGDDVQQAKALVLEHRLSKYNHAPLLNADELLNHSRSLREFGVCESDFLDSGVRRNDDLGMAQRFDGGPGVALVASSCKCDAAGQPPPRRVLVIDQTAGDMSVSLGGASAQTFQEMLAAAHEENPQATIYVKTHPEVTSGRKGGYLTHVQNSERTVVLRQAANPLSLIEHMDRVYVVTSTMGFEALLAGKPVSVFGMPWYAGWGATDDRQVCARRSNRRSVDELFAAAYFHYPRYLNPVTRSRGTIFDAIDWLVRQRTVASHYSGRMICIGFRRWKAANIKPLLSLNQKQVLFFPTVDAARVLDIGPADCLVFWGRDAPSGLLDLAKQTGCPALRMEDGFVRSVGLGSDFIRPLSLVLDEHGIYFDPTQPSGLEQILNTATFGEDELIRARRAREFIVEYGITKYNLESREPASWPSNGKTVVLIPGQVEDDASIRYGCSDIKTNLELLKAARKAHPEAFIVYKPHPDVMSGNRAGKIALAEAGHLADHVETRLSVVSCIDACDIVHTMTSLTGFDALLRGKRVVVYGQPFYAGWGLTEDVLKEGAALDRRRRRLSLDELVAGTLLRYPLYWDWELKGYTTCEAVLHRLAETRDALESCGGLEKLRVGFIRRQLRKLRILAQAWMWSA